MFIFFTICLCRFYDKAEFVTKGIGHYKLKCEGLVIPRYQCSIALSERLLKVWQCPYR